MEALGNSNMNLIELDFCDVAPSPGSLQEESNPHLLEDSEQLQHTYKLTALRTLKIPVKSVNSLVKTFQQNPISLSITQLFIECRYRSLHVDWLLEMFPSLEDLHISQSKCNTKRYTEEVLNNSSPKHDRKTYINLHRLTISHCRIYPQVLDFVKTVAPNLTHLSLYTITMVSEPNGGVYLIDLSGYNLKEFTMLRTYYESPHVHRSNHHFTIRTNTNTVMYATSGDSISLTRVGGVFGKFNNITKINNINDALIKTRISKFLK
ncbi:hypothetical protein K501DRAFT_338842 [Backusella circina FSU 941]|nr:hypothetical protein K501DRAFT_338842 [Backusella circina FSU 941]